MQLFLGIRPDRHSCRFGKSINAIARSPKKIIKSNSISADEFYFVVKVMRLAEQNYWLTD